MFRKILLQLCHRLGLMQSYDKLLASRDLLAAGDRLSESEKELMRRVSPAVHRHDGMYVPAREEHYFSVGLSAIAAINEGLLAADRQEPLRRVLDFPCGFGRVLRFLKVQFQDAELFASELNKTALEFCQTEFEVKSFASDVDFQRIDTVGDFDLIWCGSLLTHLDEQSSAALLRFFYANLAVGGICIFTTCGEFTRSRLESGSYSYNLSQRARKKVLRGYYQHGYGFENYRFRKGYGISLSSREKIQSMAEAAGSWQEILYTERGWDNHQDVFVFQKQ